MIIAFSGCSGSGKTTQLKKLIGWDYFKGRKVIVKDEDDFLLLRVGKKILGEDRFSNYNTKKMSTDSSTDSKGSLFSALVSLLYPLAVYFEFCYDHFIYEIVFKNKILLKDRYIYDYLVTFEHNLKLRKPLVEYFYLRFPRPYLLFHLDADLKIILERNKNNIEGKITGQEEFHDRVLSAYRKISKKKNILIVKNHVKGSADEIKMHIRHKDKLKNVKRIVLTGLDGSGKTTLANNFTDYLSKLNISWKVAHFYHDNMLHKFLKRVGYYSKGASEKEVFENSRAHNIKVKESGKPFIWGLAHYIDSYIQLLFFNIVFFNKLIIYDRYFYDFIVSFEFLRVPHIKFFEKLIVPVKNKFLLTCSPDVMFKRKPETTLEFATEHYEIYHDLVNKYELVTINSEKNSPKEVLEKLVSNIKI